MDRTRAAEASGCRGVVAHLVAGVDVEIPVGVDVAAFAEGLNPAPPPLEDEEILRLSDGEIFWVIKTGIRMTGMPAFEDAYESEEVWQIVAYVRHLLEITEEEVDYLRFAAGPEDESERGE